MLEMRYVLPVAVSAATRVFDSRTKRPEFEPWLLYSMSILDFFLGKLPVYLQVAGHLR
jgi:hypothetical protein